MKTDIIKDFERMLAQAEARALSALSLERPLSDQEHVRFLRACRQTGVFL